MSIVYISNAQSLLSASTSTDLRRRLFGVHLMVTVNSHPLFKTVICGPSIEFGLATFLPQPAVIWHSIKVNLLSSSTLPNVIKI